MQLLSARATSNRLVSTKFGGKRVIDAITQDGQQVTLWRPVDDQASKSIVNGSRIHVAIDDKGKASLIESPADHAAEATKPLSLPFEAEQQLKKQMGFAVQPEPGSRSVEIADYVERLGKLYGHCYQTAFAQLGNSTPLAIPEIKDVTTTLFIQACKHFQI